MVFNRLSIALGFVLSVFGLNIGMPLLSSNVTPCNLVPNTLLLHVVKGYFFVVVSQYEFLKTYLVCGSISSGCG